MPDYQKFTVITSSGARGYVLRKARFLDRSEQNTVVLEDGREFVVPSDALQVQNDGTFRVADDRLHDNNQRGGSAPRNEEIVDPDFAHQFEAPPAPEMNRTEVRASAVQAPTDIPHLDIPHADIPHRNGRGEPEAQTARTNGAAREVTLDERLFADEVAVERVPVNRIVDQMPETRQEGDVLIVPVVEEVLMVQKRLLLKEEVRIQRRRNEVQQPRRIVLTDDETRVIGSDGRDITPGR